MISTKPIILEIVFTCDLPFDKFMKYMTELNFIASSLLYSAYSSGDADSIQWLLDNYGH